MVHQIHLHDEARRAESGLRIEVGVADFRDQAIEMSEAVCQSCGASAARRYQLVGFGKPGKQSDERESLLCARCVRAERKRLEALPDLEDGLTRQELIATLDRFFASSGVFDICRRC